MLKFTLLFKKIVSFIFLLCFFFSSNIFAQLDSEHYLPPLKQVANNQAIQEQAVYFSTPVTTPFVIEIYRGTSVTPYKTISGLAKGSPKIFDSSGPTAERLNNGDNNITLVTNANTGEVLSSAGLRIIAPGGEKFYVNYRGVSGAQAGSLTSKGAKAKGIEFRWGGIPNRATNTNLSTSLGMMATEDGTVVQVFGYNTECRFRKGTARGGITADTQTINLNKGQSFVLEAAKNETTANIDGWLGASITSNKPIVISNGGLNVGIRSGSQSRDVGIDQPVGLSALGKEYVFVRGNGINGNSSLGRIGSEFPIIVGTRNGTEVRAGGVLIGTINDGEYLIIDGSNFLSNVAGASMYVNTTKDVYAYQCLQGAVGKIQTIGMNFIAPVNCLLPSVMDEISDIAKIAGKASNISAITIIASKLTNPNNIIVRQTVISPTDPSMSTTTTVSLPAPVFPSGTDDWQTFYVDGLEGQIDIKSTGPIAVGTFMSQGSNAGLAGYFSGFDTVPVVRIDVVGGGCYPQTSLQEATGGFDAYQWYQDGEPIAGETNNQLLLIDASKGKDLGLGNFYVSVTKGTCSYPSATISVYNCDPDVLVKKVSDVNTSSNMSTLTDDDLVNFTVTVESNGINPVTNLVIEDTFPPELELQSVTPVQGTWSNPNWTIGNMYSGQIFTLNIVAKVPKKPTEGIFTNVVSNTQTETDSNFSADDLTETINIVAKKIDLTLTKTVDKAIPKVGSTIIFTLTLKNNGPDVATGIEIKDLLPSGLAYNASSSTFPNNTTYTASTGILDLSGITIANGQMITLKLATTVTAKNLKLNTAEIFKTEQIDINSIPNSNN
ncbi:DUF11 domain-containing protein [uncultured Polaribacter sp.]|uniref:DUF11 domain-containing protein n=1 Tax=uncultured Polaribacter sp. TaxID=174711 RepID=UPI00261E18BA|nr:DUF11 domain-containing protein [uncultured Polaribacter sp.]